MPPNVLAGTDEFRITSGAHQPDLGAVGDQSVNPLNFACDACIGPLNTDARHRVTLGAIYRAPWNLVVAGIYRYRSALPYTEWTGIDVNGDGYALDLAPGVTEVNSRRGVLAARPAPVARAPFRQQPGCRADVRGVQPAQRGEPVRFIGNRRAANFGQPTVFAGDPLQGEQRLAQIGVRLRFN